MLSLAQKKKKTFYFNIEKNDTDDFADALYDLLTKQLSNGQEIILLCVGSDRATGDCLGPIVGYKLGMHHPDILIYGSLKHPVHAKNLDETILYLKKQHPGAFVIAIDASLGVPEHIGYVTLGNGPLKPGIGVDKNLPSVGNLYITGIVNSSGLGGHSRLQTTRLGMVMRLADFISDGILMALQSLHLL